MSKVSDALRALQARIRAQAHTQPGDDAISLVLGGHQCGSMAPRTANCLAGVRGFVRFGATVQLEDTQLDVNGRSQRLHDAAQALLRAGLIGAWRTEELDVRAAPDAPVLARIDRSAVRALGITTYSVHCNGYTADGRLLVAQRAADKRVDPGLWDNLAGGMIAAGESARAALEREAFEEAGIRLAALPVQAGARLSVRRRIGEGMLSEFVQVFDVALPPGTRAVNQDGEVARFSARAPAAVIAAIEQGEFTVEAALATIESLLRRAG